MVKVNEKPEEKSPNPQDFGPQSSLFNDGSFVVLEESSVEGMTVQLPNSHLPPSLTFDGLPSLGNSTLGPSNTNGQGASYMSTSMTTDLSPEEIQNKLRELLCENVELKDTLNQNNMAMRQQFQTLVKWQEEVLKVHQNHKEKFAETRDLINKLRNENEELKKCIAEMKSEGSTISIALDQQQQPPHPHHTLSEPLVMASMGVTPCYTISNKVCLTHSPRYSLAINEENLQIRLSALESEQLDGHMRERTMATSKPVTLNIQFSKYKATFLLICLVIVATGLFCVILWLVVTRLPLCWSGDSGVYFSTAVESKVVWRFFKTLWILAWESWSTRGSHWLM
uniref:NF-kappa-B essential modulator NEMO N-terminal domain-containing protein n=1 Tax=Timema douglasi TaxID=61478 RepID=A0A7R8VMQ2_TIMDO|nr:unnamed protein product [Timema douglasi]